MITVHLNKLEMLKSKLTSVIALLAICLIYGCSETDPVISDHETGSVQLSIGFDIDETPIDSYSRTAASTVNTDDFVVSIYTEDGEEFLVIDQYAEATEGISLPAGVYHIEAHSPNDLAAAFDNPYYFGKSERFSIGANESKSIQVEASLANTQVSIILSEEQVGSVSEYTTIVEHIETQERLTFTSDETRSGYFRSGELYIKASFTYDDAEGYPVQQNVATTIKDAKPKTHYEVKVNLTLENGEVIPVVTVDEDIELVEIDANSSSYSIDWTYHLQPAFTDNDVIASDMVGTSDGGLLLTLSSIREPIRIVKLSASGELEWEKNYLSSVDFAFYNVIESHDQQPIFFGNVSDASYLEAIVKLDAMAERKVWQRTLNEQGSFSDHELVETSDHSILASMTIFRSTSSGDESSPYITKITEGGERRVWTRRYNVMNKHKLNSYETKLIAETTDGNIIVVGSDYDGKHWVGLISSETGALIKEQVLPQNLEESYWFIEGDYITVFYKPYEEQPYAGKLDMETFTLQTSPLHHFDPDHNSTDFEYSELFVMKAVNGNFLVCMREDNVSHPEYVAEYDQSLTLLSESAFNNQPYGFSMDVQQPLMDGTIVLIKQEYSITTGKTSFRIEGYKKD